MFQNEKTKLTLFALFVALFWGYSCEWLPYYANLFQSDNLKVLGRINNFREECREPTTDKTFCSDQYRIPVELLPEDTKNKSIGFGSMTSEIVVGCLDDGKPQVKIFLGDLERPYRKSNIFREYRLVNLDTLQCKENLLVQAWARHSDVRHGLIASSTVVGETAAVDDLRKLYDYVVNGVLLLISVFSIPLVILLSWFRNSFTRESKNAPFFLLLNLWVSTIFLVGGLIQMLVPIGSLHLFFRIIANLFLLVSILFTGDHYFRRYDSKNVIARALNFLCKPIFSNSRHFLTVVLTPAFLLVSTIFLFSSWPSIVTYMTFGILSLFLIFSKKIGIEFRFFAALGILSEIKIINIGWAPESSTYIIFIFFILIIELILMIRNEVSETLYNYINNSTNDKKLSAQIVHDIRSPLGVLKLLIDKVEWKSDQNSIREVVVDSINSISSVSRSVLSAHKNPALQRSSIEPILKALDEVRMRFSRSITIRKKIDKDSIFAMDSITLYRMAQNMFSNAFETPNVKNIEIEVSTLGTNRAMFQIINDGDMPPKDILDNILSSGGTYGKKDGTGLGVLFCKTEVEKHGGTFSMKLDSGRMIVEIVI